MRRVRVDDVERLPGPASAKRKLTDELGTTGLALAHYERDEGESSAFGYYAHAEQEEVFYVSAGRSPCGPSRGRSRPPPTRPSGYHR